ncbi:nickel-dependent lactate racemase [Deferribacter autotrophicus]|uniref:Nickel-dependent lactate racemase n=1 Tax=Deferribacter autotrophicus TaxID=500465 RepID=A0A5A8F6Q6_9BACT|nr:nickel-dependent lactate racemase [Deferribacter autotrophicus]KAA0257665.1 nickel-dependent lactate racemase [Deferribacter autotrophicus]
MKLPYGKSHVDINIKKDFDLLNISIDKEPLSIDEIFLKLEEAPVYSEGFSRVLENARKILFIVPDITRKSGLNHFFPVLIKKIEEVGVPFSIIFATGTHRKVTEDEKKWIITDEVYEKYKDRLIDHDPDDPQQLEYFGKTKNGTPILLNKAYLEHDTIIPIASVSYHYFAGFGGGRKMILPGIASRKSALNNHKLVLDIRNSRKHPLATAGNLKQNPVNDDIVEAVMIARRGKTFFAINTILNDKGEIIDLTCGDLFMSHIAATELLKKYTMRKVDKKYDLIFVSCGGFPKDINMVQAQKSLDRVVSIAEEGADILFFAECQDGYGNDYFEQFFDINDSNEMFQKLVDDYQINRQTAYSLKVKTEKYNVYFYSNFDETDCKRMGFKKLEDLSKIDELVEKRNNIAVVPDAYNIFFDVKI